MSKLSLDALKERAGAVASEELLNSISGGTANDCHPGPSWWEIALGLFILGNSTGKPQPQLAD
jgi:hypothetical protein